MRMRKYIQGIYSKTRIARIAIRICNGSIAIGFASIARISVTMTKMKILTLSIEGYFLMTSDGGRFTRAEHMQWCKHRAIEYVNIGDLQNAVRSMLSDLQKHPDTKNDRLARATGILLLSERLDKDRVRMWIEGSN